MSENKYIYYIDKYKDLFKANIDKKTCRDNFVKMMEFLDYNGGILITPYISKNDIVSVNIFGGTLTIKQVNLIKSINRIKICIEIINKNGDVFCNIVEHKTRVHYQFTSLDGKVFIKSMNEYTKYIQGRDVFWKLLKSNGHMALTPYINNHTKVLINFNCEIHKPSYKSPCEYKISQKCQQCSRQVVTRGFNDIATTRPDLIKYFKDKDDIHKYSKGSNQKIQFKCPDCGAEKYDMITNVSCFGFSCPSCSDGISFPEKFMYNILLSLNEKFTYQYQPNWISPKRYDFYLKKYNIIIEMDGGLGHGHNAIGNSVQETLNLDMLKDKKAKEHNIQVIRIDCNYGYLKNRRKFIELAIKHSELSDYLNLSKINFDEIEKMSNNSYVLDIWKLYSQGYSTTQISKMLPFSVTSITHHLKNGNELGMVKYDAETIRKNQKQRVLNVNSKPCKIIDIETNIILYFSSENECRKEMKMSTVSIHAKNHTLYKNRYKVIHISKQEFNDMKLKSPENTFGDFFNLQNDTSA